MLSTVFVLSSTTNRRPFPTAYILCPISISQDSLREKIVILQVKMTQWMVQMAKLVCPSYCLFFFDLRHIINSLGSSNCSWTNYNLLQQNDDLITAKIALHPHLSTMTETTKHLCCDAKDGTAVNHLPQIRHVWSTFYQTLTNETIDLPL